MDKCNIVPMMPRASDHHQERRSKLDSTHWKRQYIVARHLVARNLTKKEVAAEPRAQDAPREQYERLEKKQTWMLDT
eukprot:8722244-Pyramimonas_sp.AAC.1